MKIVAGDVIGRIGTLIELKKCDVQGILERSIKLGRVPNAQAGVGLHEYAIVTDSLYLSSASAAVGTAYRVNCVVNAAAELPDTPLPHAGVIYLKVDVYDKLDADLSPYFDMVADLVEMVRKNGGKTLIHCVAGVSRSASLCLAYLMKYHRMSLRSAYTYLKTRRPLIRPNIAFFRQLIDYERQLFGHNTVHMIYNDSIKMQIPDVYAKEYSDMVMLHQQNQAQILQQNLKSQGGTNSAQSRRNR